MKFKEKSQLSGLHGRVGYAYFHALSDKQRSASLARFNISTTTAKTLHEQA